MLTEPGEATHLLSFREDDFRRSLLKGTPFSESMVISLSKGNSQSDSKVPMGPFVGEDMA